MKTSLKLSKLLSENGCELESEWYWQHIADPMNSFDLGEYVFINKKDRNDLYSDFPDYDLLWDICVKYAKEFFAPRYKYMVKGGDGKMHPKTFTSGQIYGGQQDMYIYTYKLIETGERISLKYNDERGVYEQVLPSDKSLIITEKIFKMLQQNKIQEAEDYIWENCLFNPKNK